MLVTTSMVDYSGSTEDLSTFVAKQFAGQRVVAERCLNRMPSDSKVELFFQKDAPPSVIRTDYFAVEDPAFIKNNIELSQRKKVEAALNGYLSLQPNWDGYGGRGPKENAVFDALMFLSRLPFGKKVPIEMIAGDGDVGLSWDTDEVFIEVGFNGSGSYYFYVEKEDEEAASDDVSVMSASIPQELIRHIPS